MMAAHIARQAPSVILGDELDALGAVTDAHPSPYHRRDWYRMTRDHVLGHVPLVTARAADGADSAWLVLTRGGETYASWYALRAGPAFSGARRGDLLTAIAAALRPRFTHLSIGPMDGADAALSAAAFRAAGWRVRDSEATANWVAHVAGATFADYWAARPSRLRNTVRRKARAASLEIVIHRDFDADAWDDYADVYAASWKPQEGSIAFLRAMAVAAARPRLGIAYDRGRPVAAQFWTIDGDVATIHKLAYRSDAAAQSPGTLLGHAMFAHVIDRDRPALIDYGTGDDAYKADWMDERRSLRRIEAWNPRRIGGIVQIVKAHVLNR